MADKLEPGDKLFAGVILAIVGLVGIVFIYRSLDYSIIIGDVKSVSSFNRGGLSMLSLVIITLFTLVTLLGSFVVYDTVKKDKRHF